MEEIVKVFWLIVKIWVKRKVCKFEFFNGSWYIDDLFNSERMLYVVFLITELFIKGVWIKSY